LRCQLLAFPLPLLQVVYEVVTAGFAEEGEGSHGRILQLRLWYYFRWHFHELDRSLLHNQVWDIFQRQFLQVVGSETGESHQCHDGSGLGVWSFIENSV